MKNPNQKKSKLNTILDGNGFYIAIAVCFAILAASSYFTINTSKNKEKTVTKQEINSVDYTSPSVVSLAPTASPVPKATGKPSNTTKPTPNAKAASSVATNTTPNTPSVDANFKITPPLDGTVLRDFSGDTLVYSPTLDDWRVHNGIDIKANLGAQVKAVQSGVVEKVYYDDLLGTCIVIDHQNGYKSLYANLSTDEMTGVGQKVAQGDVISGVGKSAGGESLDESHLHFELIKDGVEVKPY